MLTCIWDQFMLRERKDSDSELLFRCPTHSSNLSYLFQVLELAHLSIRVYLHQPIYIVLSAMYLLLRIGL